MSALRRRHSDDCRTCGGRLVRIDRGEGHTLELIDDAGNVLIVHAHGVHDDEKLRVREAALRLLRGVLAPELSR